VYEKRYCTIYIFEQKHHFFQNSAGQVKFKLHTTISNSF